MNLKLVDQYYNSPEYLTALRNRASQLKKATESELGRTRMILDHWSVDPVEFIETFLFIKLPNYQNSIKPFFLFPYQKEIIQKLMESEQDSEYHDILIDKPREMGLTWIVVAYMYWRWLFTPNWSGFILSRSEAEVDDGSTSPDSSIFGKFRWLISMTPDWLIPEGFTPKGKKGTTTDMMLKLYNPQMQSSLIGSTTNTRAGRSRRYSITFVDECFYIENFNQVWRSLESVSRIKVFASSAKAGRQNDQFVKLCDDRGDHIQLKWQDHPWKDEEWFKELQRKAEFDPEILKEAVVNYAIDARSQYYPQISQAKVERVVYDPKKPLFISVDVGRGDLTVMIWWQYDGGNFRIVECYANKNKEISWYAPFLNPELDWAVMTYPTEHQQELLKRLRTWRKPVAWFGEHDHFKKSMASNLSVAQVLAKLGINLRYNQYAINYEPRRIATSLLLPHTIFNAESDYVMNLYDALLNSRYSAAVSPLSSETVKKPVHDNEIADYRSAFENGAVNIPRIMRLQRQEPRSENMRSLTGDLTRYLRI